MRQLGCCQHLSLKERPQGKIAPRARRWTSVVVLVGRPDEDAEVVVPGGGDAPEAGDEEEDAGEDVAGAGAVEAEGGPVAGGEEGIDGEAEEDDADAEADGGVDEPGHVGAPLRCWDDGIGAAEEVSRRAVLLALDPGVVLPGDAVVGAFVAAHEPWWLRAKT